MIFITTVTHAVDFATGVEDEESITELELNGCVSDPLD
jgi:hypothetical protein